MNNQKKMISHDNKTLKKYHAIYDKDTEFASHARLLQSIWREQKQYPMDENRDNKYGNFLDPLYAKKYKVNFLTDKIKELVPVQIRKIKSQGGMIKVSRMWNNLLSSQPLCFNLFGELYHDLDLTTKVFKELSFDWIKNVTSIKFEYSTRRGNPDRSAFDVFVEYLDTFENRCFIGIEVKYQESLREESEDEAANIFNKHKAEYCQIAKQSKVFVSNSIDILKIPPLSQIWRDHLLMFNMANDYHDSMFMYLYPFENTECHNGVSNYKKYLVSNDLRKNRFLQVDLKVFINTLNKVIDADWTKELEKRYIGTK